MSTKQETCTTTEFVESRGVHACPGCGFRRNVKVTQSREVKITYERTYRDDTVWICPIDSKEIKREEGPLSRISIPYCTACRLLHRAAVHQREADRFTKQAKEILKKRAERLAKLQ